MVLSQNSRFLIWFFVFLLSSCTTCGLCLLSTIVWFLSSHCGVFLYVNDSNRKANSIKQSHQIMIINILQNLSHMYSSHHRIIKCVGFKPIHCVTYLDDVSSFRVFNEFDYVFLSNLLLV